MSLPSPAWPDPATVEIGPEAVAALRTAATPFRLIDCREPDEWDLTHIEGAELLPLSIFADKYPGTLPDQEEPIVIHCHHGMRSAKATLFLRQKGYSRVWSLARGIEGWSLEVDPAVPRY
jgi:adenylyltransferase/sulfurtransferase